MIRTIALLTALAGACSALQSPTESTTQRDPWPVIPIKSRWRKLPENVFPSGKKLQEMRNARLDEQIAQERRSEKPNNALISDLERQKDNQVTPLDVPRASEKRYEYRVLVRNTTARTVTALKWTYIFKDPITREELVRQTFDTKQKIAAGKQKEVIAYSDSSPPLLVSAQAKTKPGSGWDEVVMIDGVQFKDGSGWSRQE